jgi:hypothetical protein
MGNAEYIFGTSLGNLSSEMPINSTTFISTPQLMEPCEDGTTIVGAGYSVNIISTCSCSRSYQTDDLILAGVSAAAATNFTNAVSAQRLSAAMMNSIVHNRDEKNIEITTILTGNNICVSGDPDVKPVPVCKTVMSNHFKVLSQIRYMSDGSRASITPDIATLIETQEEANLTWVEKALTNYFGGEFSSFGLPPTYPQTVNPMMWWATVNMRVIINSFRKLVEPL